MVQHSILDEAESQVAYLDNACKTLRLAAEDMDKTIRGWMREPVSYPVDWVLDYCSVFYLVLREMERVRDDLDAAVTKEYVNRRNQNGTSGASFSP